MKEIWFGIGSEIGSEVELGSPMLYNNHIKLYNHPNNIYIIISKLRERANRNVGGECL